MDARIYWRVTQYILAMRAVIIAEGRGDLAVIANILKGKLGINRADIKFQRPEYNLDETDMYAMRAEQYSNWSLVKYECKENRDDLEYFLSLKDDNFIIIHIDTAERTEKGYDVLEPARLRHLGEPQKSDHTSQEEYCSCLRENVIHQINTWLGNSLQNRIAYAIAIEETEAWIMTLYGETLTSKHLRPKEKLEQVLNRKLSDKDKKKTFPLNEFEQQSKLSIGFAKPATLRKCWPHNKSLESFCMSLEQFKQ